MVHRFFTGLACALLLLQGTVFAAAPPAEKRGSFAAALDNTQLGSDPTQAYFLMRVLKETRAADADVEALRRELLHTYMEQLGGLAPPPLTPAPKQSAWVSIRSHWPGGASAPHDTVATAMARGRARDSVLDATFVTAWEAAFDKSLEVRWPTTNGALPYFAMQNRNLQLIAPGVWASESAKGEIQFMLSLHLFNKAALAIPIWRPDMVWGGEPATGRGGLSFSCDWDGVRPPPGRAALDAVEMLAPGGESRAMVCTTPPAGTYWKEQLPALVVKAQNQGLRPLLVSHAFESRQRLPYLEVALGDLSSLRAGWIERLRTSQQEVGRRWRPAEQPLAAPVAQRWGVSPNDGGAAAGLKLQWFLGATLMALTLFAVGRKALRWGSPQFVVGLATLLVAGGLLVAGVAKIDGGGGTGYSSPFSYYVTIALWSAVVGPMLLWVWALHAVQKLLDAEHLSWLQSVALGWRRALDFGSDTSRAEFWGFFLHCVWLWALARICLVPLDRWVGAVLLIPFAALWVRRLRSLTERQRLDMAITAGCVVLIVLAEAF